MTHTATLYRMVLPDHVCPFGIRAKALIEQSGFELDDRPLRTRKEVDQFMLENGLETTPLVLIDGEAVGGCDELERYLAERGEA